MQETQLPDKIHYKPNEIQNIDDPSHQQKQENQEKLTTSAESPNLNQKCDLATQVKQAYKIMTSKISRG